MSRDDFTMVALQGFGDRQNSYAWSMAWFNNQLLVGTDRAQACVGFAGHVQDGGPTSRAKSMSGRASATMPGFFPQESKPGMPHARRPLHGKLHARCLPPAL